MHSPGDATVMTHPLPVAGKLPIKTLVARQLPTSINTHTHTYTHTHTHIYVLTLTHVLTCIHAHTRTHTYMYIQIQKKCVGLLFMQTSPLITPHARSFVHHMLIYFCPYALDPSLVGVGGPCNQVHQNISGCQAGLLIGAWAVGGEVSS